MIENIVEIIKAYGVKGSKYGLQRTRALLDALSSPDKRLKIVHVAGSNGKGSIAEYVSRCICESGARVGTFTSPEAYSYGENFRINCAEPDGAVLKEYLSRAYELSLTFEDKPTAFEIETCAALSMFAGEGCEYAVVECGLGGRDDATNAIACKEVAVFGSVSLEHTAILGDTVTEICKVKSGIIKDCPAVVSAYQCAEARAFFGRLGAVFAGDDLHVVSRDINSQTFTTGGKSYTIKMHGTAQCYNAAAAIKACEILGIDGEAIRVGLGKAVLGGRTEVINARGKTYVLDGAHNPAAFAPLLELLDGYSCPKTLVYGCLSDKDVQGCARALCGRFRSAIVFSPPSYRAMDEDKIIAAFGKVAQKVSRAPSVGAALGRAEGDFIVVCGSFTFLKEAKQWIEKEQ